MAQLKNKQFATFDRTIWGSKSQVVVGHNRTLSIRTDTMGNEVLEFRLHGNLVVEYIKWANGTTRTIHMDDCGYKGPTTGQAIKDALKLFGFAGGVSFAKGGFKPSLSVLPYDRDKGYAWMRPVSETDNTALYQWEV